MPGLGFKAGALGDENLGAGSELLPDENLEVRHHKKGMLTMVNDGSHSNGSEFMVTFGEASYLDGYFQHAFGSPLVSATEPCT